MATPSQLSGPPISHSLRVVALTTLLLAQASAGYGPPQAPVTADQVNTADWNRAWTNILNDTRQTFTPSLPRLSAVEVELVVANPGPADDTLTLTILDGRRSLAAVSKDVRVSDSDHVLFVLPNTGLKVAPGHEYSIRVRGGPLYGWKYVVGGYKKGSASVNGKPLLSGARSTFLFRTFGGD